MLLTIDAGNTNVKFAIFDGAELKRGWRIATDVRRTADEYAVWLLQLLAIDGYSRDAVDAVIIASVVPRATHNLVVLSTKYFGVEPVIAGRAPAEWGIALDVKEPHAVGADRAVNAIAAHHLHAGELVVISFGTATTFDWIGTTGAYKGGIIAPGINLSLEALVGAAAKLPRIAIEAPADASVIGRTTESQMLIGVYWGYVGLIEGLIARMKQEIGRPVSVVATGGLAPLFESHTHLFDAIEPDLTLRGLQVLHARSVAS